MHIAGKDRKLIVNVLLNDLVQGETGVNLFQTTEGAVVLGLKEDPSQAAKVLYFLTRTDGETMEQFFTNLKGEEIFDGVQALWGALADFFPSPKKEAYRKAIRIGQLADEAMLKVISNPLIESKAQDLLERATQELLAKFDGLSTSSPA